MRNFCERRSYISTIKHLCYSYDSAASIAGQVISRIVFERTRSFAVTAWSQESEEHGSTVVAGANVVGLIELETRPHSTRSARSSLYPRLVDHASFHFSLASYPPSGQQADCYRDLCPRPVAHNCKETEFILKSAGCCGWCCSMMVLVILSTVCSISVIILY